MPSVEDPQFQKGMSDWTAVKNGRMATAHGARTAAVLVATVPLFGKEEAAAP